VTVKRIVANIAADDLSAAKRFYGDVLGLDQLMDHGWIVTYGSSAQMSVQVSVAGEGGSGTPVPDLSIEVDDLEATFAKIRAAGFAVEYGVRPCRRTMGRPSLLCPRSVWAPGEHPQPYRLAFSHGSGDLLHP
jgi:catechol 2,3-dioxygenase-like lactoylglutathione lyase family enzyme